MLLRSPLLFEASIPPAKAFFWAPAVKPALWIKTLNIRLRALAADRGAVWVEYHERLTDPEGGLPDNPTNGGVHPNRNGYAIMRPLAEQAKLILANVTDQEAADIMGWSPDQVAGIRRVYVDQSSVIVAIDQRIARAL